MPRYDNNASSMSMKGSPALDEALAKFHHEQEKDQQRMDNRSDFILFLDYLDIYKEIQDNPRARQALRHHPGVKFMKWWMRLPLIILSIMAIIGAMFG